LRRSAVLLIVVGLVGAPAASAQPAPFGHACEPRFGVRVCPTAADADRVPSFDGVPLDVDVTLPATGEGPWPTLAMLHGFPGDKTAFEAIDDAGDQEGHAPLADRWRFHRNDVFYAHRGYAVVTYSARGFGRSCGTSSSRGPGCERGWTHLFDQRYEARDTQHLLGVLVDEGIAQAGGLGVTGSSGGSAQALELAFLRNRIRLPDGRFAVWRSPTGRRLAIGAAFPTWPSYDVVAGLVPNGRFLDFDARRFDSASPLGVPDQFIEGLFAVAQASGFVAPRGADPTADLSTWKDLADRGEPFGSAVRSVAGQLTRFHGASRLGGIPAPLLVQAGWADDVFPATQALAVYDAVRARNPAAPIALQVLDTGHQRGGAHLNQERAANDQAAAFFDAVLLHRGRPPRAGSVLAYTQSCPRLADGGLRIRARTWTAAHPGAVRLAAAGVRQVTSEGGNPDLGTAFAPLTGTDDACRTVPLQPPGAGTAALERTVRGAGFTLLGRPTVEARVVARGPFGQLDSRLWDVDPATGTQLLVTRGAYRLRPNQRGAVVFQLNGNGYRFAPGHRVRLELVGRDAPYLRPSNGSFAVDVSRLRVELPVREAPSRARGILKPRFAVDPALG
jgi:hypothetical protein